MLPQTANIGDQMQPLLNFLIKDRSQCGYILFEDKYPILIFTQVRLRFTVRRTTSHFGASFQV